MSEDSKAAQVSEQSTTEIDSSRDDSIRAIQISGWHLRAVVFSLCLAQFLAALDTTIVATALPTITSHLQATAGQYTWIGSSYTLASTATTPLWSKCSNIWGRKPMLLLANLAFMAGSLVAGLAQTVGALIAGRTLQGLGGGGIMILCTIVLADLFTLRDRAKYYSLSAIVWAVSSGLGPVLGGVFTQTIGWRWCFFINLPFDGMSLVLLTFILRIKTPETTLLAGLKSFDWIGSITIVGGTICFLCGLESGSEAQHGWTSALTLGLLLGGIALLIVFGVYENRWARSPLIPLQALANRYNVAAILTAVLHGFVFIAFDFFLPLYFQVVLGASPIHSGLYMFALVLPLSAASFATGQFIRRTGRYQLSSRIGAALMTLGTGLFIDFEARTVWWKIIIYQIIAGIGAGPLFLSPMLALQHHLPKEQVATGTSAMSFLRMLATSASIVVGGVVLQNVGLKSESLTAPSTTISHHSRRAVSPMARQYTAALSKMWIFYTAVCGLMMISSMFIGKKATEESQCSADMAPSRDPDVGQGRNEKSQETA